MNETMQRPSILRSAIRPRAAGLAALMAALALGGAVAQAPVGAAGPGDGEAWTLAGIAARAVAADPAVRASSALAGIAAEQYALELDKARPKLSLGLTPLAYDQRRVFDFSAINLSSFKLSDAYVDSTTLSGGAGLGYSQSLPTAGSLSAGFKGSLGATIGAEAVDWALSPSFNLSLRQPLFAGGQFLPFGAATAGLASAAIGAEQAVLDDLGRRNQALRAAVETAGRVMVLRRTLALQEASLASALERAESLSLRRGAGTATEDAALELALGAELVRQSLVDTRLALGDSERRLASALGLQGPAGSKAIVPPLSEDLPALPALEAFPFPNAPDAARAALALRKTQADADARALIDAPALGASLLATPRYPDKRQSPSDLGTIFSDFGDTEGGAGLNLNLSLTLDVPLTAGAAREARRRLDSLALEAAEAQRLQAERSVADRAASLAGRRDALRERLAIQRRIAQLDGRKAERAASLASTGTIPKADATEALLERERALIEVLRLELELLVAELDLRALAGEDLANLLVRAR